MKDVVLEEHVKTMFVNNTHPKLKFIDMDYTHFSFSNIIHILIQKERHMVKTQKLKYGDPSKEKNKGLPKNKKRSRSMLLKRLKIKSNKRSNKRKIESP